MLRARQEQRKGILSARRAVNRCRQDHLDPRLQCMPLTMSISTESDDAPGQSRTRCLASDCHSCVRNWLGGKRQGRTSAFRFGSVPMSLGHRKVTGLAGAFWGEWA